MFVRAVTHAALLVAGLIAGGARGDVVGGHPLTVASSTGFATVAGTQPTSAFGFEGDWTRGGADGSVTVPFAGWADFGLPGDGLSVVWNFSATDPDRYLWWCLTPRSEPGRILAGLAWNGTAWTSIGATMLDAAGTGEVHVTLTPSDVGRTLRLSFGGLSVGPDGSAMGGVHFTSSAIPAPGSVALLGLAAAITRRRR